MSGIGLGLSQKMTQSLKMTPEMQLAVKLLQMNSSELRDKITDMIESNPLVEVDEAKSGTEKVPIEKVTENSTEGVGESTTEASKEDYDTDWEKYIEDTDNSIYKGEGNSAGDNEETSYENFVTKKDNLQEHLTKQLAECMLDSTEEKIGEYLIGLIDRNGYLRLPDSQISEMLKVPENTITKVRRSIQGMDPVGVGALDLRECLLLQAADEGYENDSVTIVISDYLEALAQKKYSFISADTGIELEEIRAAAEIIKEFNPKPGASFPSQGDVVYIAPEVFIEKSGDEYVPRLNETDLPVLKINGMYKSALLNKSQTGKAAYDFIKDKLESAKSFLRFIDKRKETILNVSRAICQVQHDFFEYGILHLKPMTLEDVSDIAGVHKSTVSRAANGKYAQTPRGLLELKFFFTGAVKTSGPEDLSSLSVKTKIGELIKNENPKKPLSDNTLAKLLKEEGINIARRTVAKYREELNIPGSSARKTK